MADWYNWIKAFHIIAVVSWMAGLFYLPRLFVYHSDVVVGGESSELFKVMERRLLGAIMRPALVATVLSGGTLLWLGGYALDAYWVLGKLFLVGLMVGFHGFLEGCAGEFARDMRRRNARFFRIINEVPTVLLITIVILVVVKPFE
jgi:protoporphyrinogen IX oxidase